MGNSPTTLFQAGEILSQICGKPAASNGVVCQALCSLNAQCLTSNSFGSRWLSTHAPALTPSLSPSHPFMASAVTPAVGPGVHFCSQALKHSCPKWNALDKHMCVSLGPQTALLFLASLTEGSHLKFQPSKRHAPRVIPGLHSCQGQSVEWTRRVHSSEICLGEKIASSPGATTSSPGATTSSP